jgi:hypothetical protein
MPPFSLQDPLGTAIFEENANTGIDIGNELEYGTMSRNLDDASYDAIGIDGRAIMCQTVGCTFVE